MARANLTVKEELITSFSEAQKDERVAALIATIDKDSETVNLEKEIESQGNPETDLKSVAEAVSDAAFILFSPVKGSSPKSGRTWNLILYCSDEAPVKLRMLYASSVEDLKRELSSGSFGRDAQIHDKVRLQTQKMVIMHGSPISAPLIHSSDGPGLGGTPSERKPELTHVTGRKGEC